MSTLLSLLGWLTGTALGRKVALWGLVAVSLGLLLLRVYSMGRAQERARTAQANIDLLRKRIDSDAEISGLSSDERVARLRKWVRD